MEKSKELVKILIDKGYTIAFAESCTGGMMASSIVDVPDASKVLNASFVTYANVTKAKYAHVNPKTIEKYGAVSEEVAKEMAEGVANEVGADVSVGISGIAGPSGGTDEKPVGTVCFGFYIDGVTYTVTKHFDHSDRNEVRINSVNFATQWLVDTLK